MPLLQLQGIQKSFPGARVLKGVSFELEAGEVHSLVGANGAGKSTLIKILAGAYIGDGGKILVDNRPAPIRTPADAIALGIGVIYQEFNLVPELSVAENVLIGQEPVWRVAGIPFISRRSIMEEATRHIRELGFPLDPAQPVKELSTAEKQLVEIAKALHRKARILVLDEPTAALSRSEARRLFTIISDLQRRGLGMIYISHHLEEVFEISDRITVLRDGTNIETWRRGRVSEAELVRAMVGREVEVGERPESAIGEPALVARNLTGDAFHDVSLQIRRGEILSLTGAAGAGLTEFCWSLYGALPIRSGDLEVAGRSVRWTGIRDAVRGGVLFAAGDRKAYGIVPQLDVKTNFTFADLRRYTAGPLLNPAKQRSGAEELIRRYGVRCSGWDQEIQSLSGGNQQKVVVGRVAERQADVYLFDEPTRGVDVGAREDIYALIHGLAQRGAAVLVSTPDIQEALRLGDRVGVMRAGRLVYEEPTAEATELAILGAILGGEGQEESAHVR